MGTSTRLLFPGLPGFALTAPILGTDGKSLTKKVAMISPDAFTRITLALQSRRTAPELHEIWAIIRSHQQRIASQNGAIIMSEAVTSDPDTIHTLATSLVHYTKDLDRSINLETSVAKTNHSARLDGAVKTSSYALSVLTSACISACGIFLSCFYNHRHNLISAESAFQRASDQFQRWASCQYPVLPQFAQTIVNRVYGVPNQLVRPVLASVRFPSAAAVLGIVGGTLALTTTVMLGVTVRNTIMAAESRVNTVEPVRSVVWESIKDASNFYLAGAVSTTLLSPAILMLRFSPRMLNASLLGAAIYPTVCLGRVLLLYAGLRQHAIEGTAKTDPLSEVLNYIRTPVQLDYPRQLRLTDVIIETGQNVYDKLYSGEPPSGKYTYTIYIRT